MTLIYGGLRADALGVAHRINFDLKTSTDNGNMPYITLDAPLPMKAKPVQSS